MPTVDPTHHDHAAAPGQDDALTVTRSEEQLQLGVRTEAVRRLRIRKQVISEEVTRTVTVRREELVVDDEPLEPGTVTVQDAGDRDIEIVLHEERVEVRTVVVPVERVTVRVRRVAGSTTVTDTLRREQIDLEEAHPGDLS